MKIFLDDYRKPKECLQYMYARIGQDNPIYDYPDWTIVKNYPEFKILMNNISDLKEITHVSFDHDLADGHYHKNMQEGNINYNSEDFNSDDYNKTGWHCAKLFKEMFEIANIPLPILYVHSMNPVGTQNIINIFK